MLKVYIAAPFRRMSSKIKDRMYGKIYRGDYINFLQSVEKILLEAGFKPLLPHRDKGLWGEIYIQPVEIAKMCFNLISSSDIVVAIPSKSRGVHVEIGYAAALKKSLIIFLKNNERESIFIPGLYKETNTIVIRYSNENDLLFKLKESIKQFNVSVTN